MPLIFNALERYFIKFLVCFYLIDCPIRLRNVAYVSGVSLRGLILQKRWFFLKERNKLPIFMVKSR